MLLKNKKTGEIVELKLIQVNDKYLEDHEVDLLKGEKLTLKSLANSFDDVKEPLIKDEKIRKAVRAWAEANRVTEAGYSSCHDAECEFNARDDGNKSIVFIGNFTEMNEELDYSGRTIYTIEELCGELQDDANM